jgi:hypothetical protein
VRGCTRATTARASAPGRPISPTDDLLLRVRCWRALADQNADTGSSANRNVTAICDQNHTPNRAGGRRSP